MKTPIDYLNDYRIMKASYQLQNTDRKIIDIALEVGFNNLSYFINRFKKTMGVTPARYRKLEK
jgi:AraC-like DNA-binding protein